MRQDHKSIGCTLQNNSFFGLCPRGHTPAKLETHNMKTKFDRVFRAVLKAAGNNMGRFEAAECAAYLLQKHGGNVQAAINEAAQPFKINGKFTY